jgi:hypothetical protein
MAPQSDKTPAGLMDNYNGEAHDLHTIPHTL